MRLPTFYQRQVLFQSLVIIQRFGVLGKRNIFIMSENLFVLEAPFIYIKLKLSINLDSKRIVTNTILFFYSCVIKFIERQLNEKNFSAKHNKKKE